jgi:uncharacterized protein (DUF1810 family)
LPDSSPGHDADRFGLSRFVEAQAHDYDAALAELRAGRKRAHWIWYVFPQLRGLGRSPASHLYGISGGDEGREHLAHAALGERLRECVSALLAHEGVSAADMLGVLDATKFRSCLTLFSVVATEEPLFAEALERFFEGDLDEETLRLLGRD